MVHSASRFDLLVFDFDGTIASSLDGITACMGAALRQFGYAAPDRDSVRRTVGLTLEESIRVLTHRACPDDQVPDVVKTYRDLHVSQAAPGTQLFEGAREVLDAVGAARIPTVLVSNKGSAGLLQLLEQLTIGSHFSLVLSADRVQHHKPSPLLYDGHIATRFPDIPRDRTLVIGDTEADLRFAANIGAASCWASYGYGDTATCVALEPTYRIAAISELLGIVRPAWS